MTRRIVTRRLQAAGTAVDGYSDRVLKYVPADVVAAWLAISALLASSETPDLLAYWGTFGALLALTPVWVLRTTRVRGMPPAWTQSVVSTAAFMVWVFATGLPFSHYDFYSPAHGGIALILFTLLAGIIDPEVVDKAATHS
jgi:hypothetical protein